MACKSMKTWHSLGMRKRGSTEQRSRLASHSVGGMAKEDQVDMGMCVGEMEGKEQDGKS